MGLTRLGALRPTSPLAPLHGSWWAERQPSSDYPLTQAPAPPPLGQLGRKWWLAETEVGPPPSYHFPFPFNLFIPAIYILVPILCFIYIPAVLSLCNLTFRLLFFPVNVIMCLFSIVLHSHVHFITLFCKLLFLPIYFMQFTS
jgi:hypothetical protein